MLTIKAEIKKGEQKANGTYNVKVRFTLNRKVKRLSTSLFVSPSDLTKSGDFKKTTKIYKKVENLVQGYKNKCNDMQVDLNDYSKKSPELFRLAIGFKNQVCCNMCIFTDGYKEDLKVTSTNGLYRAALELFNSFNPARQLQILHTLENTTMSEHQFCQILGKMRLYQSLPNYYQRSIPKMLLTDTQINSVAKAYINDENFGSFGEDINMWKFYNLLTGANKSSYIDSFLDRSLNTTQLALGINAALHGDERYKWFID